MLRSSITIGSSSDSSRPSSAKSRPYSLASSRFLLLSSFYLWISSSSFLFFSSSMAFFFASASLFFLTSSSMSSSYSSCFSSGGGGFLFSRAYPRESRIQGMNFHDGVGFPSITSYISYSESPILPPYIGLLGMWISSLIISSILALTSSLKSTTCHP